MYLSVFVSLQYVFFLSFLSNFSTIVFSVHLYDYQTISMSVYTSASFLHLSIYLSTCKSIYLPVNLSIYQSIYLSTCQSIYLPANLSLYLYLLINMSTQLFTVNLIKTTSPYRIFLYKTFIQSKHK